MKADESQAVLQKAPENHRRLAAEQGATAIVVKGDIVYRKND